MYVFSMQKLQIHLNERLMNSSHISLIHPAIMGPSINCVFSGGRGGGCGFSLKDDSLHEPYLIKNTTRRGTKIDDFGTT